MSAPTPVPTAPAGRQLNLGPAQWAVLLRLTGVTPPPWFAPAVHDEAELAAAADALADRGLVGRDGTGAVSDAVEGALAVLALPSLLVEIEVAAGDRGLRTLLALDGGLGTGLTTLPDAGVELALFPAPELGRRIARAVPPARSLQPADRAAWDALDAGPPEVPSGVLPLAALAEYLPATALLDAEGLALLADRLGLTPGDVLLARRLAAENLGTLRATVTGRLPDGAGVEQVIWFATPGGWVGARPEPDGTGRRPLRLVPVEPGDLGVWLTAAIALLLEAGEEGGDR